MTIELSFIEQNIQYWTDLKAKHHSVKSVLIFDQPQQSNYKVKELPLDQKIVNHFKDITFSTEKDPGYTWHTRPRFKKEFPLIHQLNDGFYYRICNKMKQTHPELSRNKTHNFPPFFYQELEKLLQGQNFPIEPLKEKFKVRYQTKYLTYTKEEIESYIKNNLPLNEISSWDLNEGSYMFIPEFINANYDYFDNHERWHMREVIAIFWFDCLGRASIKKDPSNGHRAKNTYPLILLKALCESFLSKRG